MVAHGAEGTLVGHAIATAAAPAADRAANAPPAAQQTNPNNAAASYSENTAASQSASATLERPVADTTRTAVRADAPTAFSSRLDAMPRFTGRLGGYEIRRKLGQGGIGAVYLARQISLDRNVALKVLSPRLAADPNFVARFTREAYAAAQLNHHNVVQIHDIGVETSDGADTNFFSMEFVEGQTLAGIVQKTGKVDPVAAAGYILQAARGLSFAHERGLIHRDVKPDNLLLNEHGVLKVADLGLVKRLGSADTTISGAAPYSPTTSAGATQANVAMGTPAYMPPEQFRDAAAADARADIYSLGCTFYDLLTGHPPFEGNSIEEVMTRQTNEAAVPPHRAARHVPPELSDIVMKMLSKKPEARYQSMAEIIAALESWLGVESGKTFSPTDENISALERAAKPFHESRAARIRTWLIRGFVIFSLIAMIVSASSLVGRPIAALAVAAFLALTTLVYQAISNIGGRTFLASNFRQLVFDIHLADWIKCSAATLLSILLVYVLGLHWVLLIVLAAATVTAAAFYLLIDLQVRKEREPFVLLTEKLLKEMRQRGLDENALRQFVARYSGDHWEEFYEALFGYEAKLAARELWGRGERARRLARHAAWRDPIVAWIRRKLNVRRETRELKLLFNIEKRPTPRKGSKQPRRRKARKAAERMVDHASRLRETAASRWAATTVPGYGPRTAEEAQLFTGIVSPSGPEAAHRGRWGSRHHESYLSRRYGSPLDLLLGRGVRLVVGLLLLLGFAHWWNQNGGVQALRQVAQLAATREDAGATASKRISRSIEVIHYMDSGMQDRQPLRIAHVPQWLCEGMGSWRRRLAGVCLILSSLGAGRLLGLTVLVAAAVIMFAKQLNLPLTEQYPLASAITGLAMSATALVFLRRQ